MSSEIKCPSLSFKKLMGFGSFILRRGFNSSKCKTEAKLATARIKLLRNRREVQVRQMRRDLAMLLQSGQDDTARIRVEHVIREQNVMAANEIIVLFCELIVVRLPIIAKQRDCPADLKEGISSLIYAAPRCSEIPELYRISQVFEKKYGKDFVSAARDLRPESGVNRSLIEKLSVRKPTGEVKMKIMKEIAKEYRIAWDATESEKELLKPPEELLEGPRSFVSASSMPVKPTVPPPNDVQAKDADFRPFNGREGSPVQFKDMASAAQAAADSAQQAVSAARAAAYLANQNSSEQKNSAGSRRQSLNSAAQAAADSAQQAVSAARAAAYLANQNSSEQKNSAGSRRQSLNSAAQAAADSAQQAVSAARAAAYLANQNSSEQKNSAGSRRQSLNSAAQAAADSAEEAVSAAHAATYLANLNSSELNNSAAQAAADSAEEAVSAAEAAAYLANLNFNEQNNSAGSRRQSLNSTRSSATKNPSVNQSNHPSKISSSQSFNTSNYMNDEDNMDSVDLDDTKVIRRNGYADRSRVHSEMKFDDSDGLDSGDEPLVLPRIDQSESKPANSSMAARVHPKLPDYESLAARFEALKSNRS